MTMKHHPHRDADRLYLPRSIGGCGMLQLHKQLKKKKALEERLAMLIDTGETTIAFRIKNKQAPAT